METKSYGWDYPPGVTGTESEITGDCVDGDDPCSWCGSDPCECQEYDNMAEADREYDR